MNGVTPYSPLARSFVKVARSSRNAGTYATAMKDMNAEPKNYIPRQYWYPFNLNTCKAHNGIDKRLYVVLGWMET